jgi:hypothetical protein
VFSRFTAEHEREFATFCLVAGAYILGSVFGNAAVSATRGVVVPFRYYVPALPVWYRAFFGVLALLIAMDARNVALRAAFVVIVISQVLRVSLIGLALNWGVVAVLFMVAGITLKRPESRWTRRPALLIIAVVVASTLFVFAVQTYSLRIFDRRREAVRPKPIAWTEDMNSTRSRFGSGGVAVVSLPFAPAIR